MAKLKALVGFRELFIAKGRVNRLQFAVYGCGNLGAMILVGFAAQTLFDLLQPPLIMDIGHATSMRRFLILALVLAGLVMLYALFCMTAKRLHDIGLPAATAVLLFGGTITDAVVTVGDNWMPLDGDLADMITMAAYILALLFVLVLVVWPGKTGENRYGADPRDDGISAEVAEH